MKKTLMTLSILSLALMMTGCKAKQNMTSASQPTSTASPTASPNVTTVIPGTTNGTEELPGMDGANGMDGVLPSSTMIPESTGVTSMETAKRVVEQIEDELERLSEVDDAEVIIAGNKAAVALEFDDQYQAGIDDRLRKIVKERIDGVISGISTIAVTADRSIMDAIESLGERLDTMSDMTALQSDLDAIIKKINGASA